MGARFKCLVVLMVLTVLDLGPFPLVSLFGIYIVLRRPAWFRNLVEAVYGERKS
jgi:hypothetical protein